MVALGRDASAPIVEPAVRPPDAAVTALVADAAVVPDPRGAEPPVAEPRGSDAVAVAHKRPPGQFSVDSTPFATIFVDDHNLGITPMIHHALPAGRHRLRAVLRDGRSQELPLDVPAGKAAAPIILRW